MPTYTVEYEGEQGFVNLGDLKLDKVMDTNSVVILAIEGNPKYTSEYMGKLTSLLREELKREVIVLAAPGKISKIRITEIKGTEG